MTRVIVALDVDTLLKEEELLKRLKGAVNFYKIGLRLFTAHGKGAVELVQRYGGRVFLDLKFLDIPQTVSSAVEEAQKLGVSSLSLHLWGGARMIEAAAKVHPRPEIWGVTVLTSMQACDLKPFMPAANLQTLVHNMARMGIAQGIDGIISSGHEVESLREELGASEACFIAPGIRPAGASREDQRRVMTPAQAARLGIDYIVVGRPIIAAADPLKAAQDILNEISKS